MPLLKNEPPKLTGGLKDQVRQIGDYLGSLYQNINYCLGHLGGNNLNGNGLTIPIRSGDGKDELGSIGACYGGAGLRSGDVALRVTPGGVEVTRDGGRTWTEVGT
jgi:hypothetical protein